MTQISGPGAPATMTGGPSDDHPEPVTIDGATKPRYVVSLETGSRDLGDVSVTVLYQGDGEADAQAAYDEADPGDGAVQWLDGGEVIEAKRSTLATVTDAREPKVGGQSSAFDAKPFTATRPEVDGVETDTMKVTFSGSWELDPMNADDVAFFNRLQRGQTLDLRVEAEVTDRSAPYKRSAQTDEETITGIAKVKVVHVYRLAAEQL